MKFKTLTEADFHQAAALIGCEMAAVIAVAEVEAPQGPFITPGLATILFEAHIFAKYTRQRYNETHPSISSNKWNRALYKGGAKEWDRFDAAKSLDETAAKMSISMGAFQIMGFNFALAGFKSVNEFFEAQNTSEALQLETFVWLIKGMRLDDELRDRRWADFARLYNGPRFRENDYDRKIAAAYAHFAKLQPKQAEIVNLSNPGPPRPTPPDQSLDLGSNAPAVSIVNTAEDTTMQVVTEKQGAPGQAPQVTTTTATVETSHASDSRKSVFAGIGASSVVAALTAVGGWFKSNASTIMVACLCVTALALIFMFRQLVLAAVREWLKGQNINVPEVK